MTRDADEGSRSAPTRPALRRMERRRFDSYFRERLCRDCNQNRSRCSYTHTRQARPRETERIDAQAARTYRIAADADLQPRGGKA